ncbi:hypothetical protein [Cellulomonas sp. HZM]|uniref:hypothetical protein n=1 Tax=Cellulomonas sp. HZM TaxID=1454010 RepID=UPI0004934B6A|nr:hypothetical protein [Cellulomonas sp. HZM]
MPNARHRAERPAQHPPKRAADRSRQPGTRPRAASRRTAAAWFGAALLALVGAVVVPAASWGSSQTVQLPRTYLSDEVLAPGASRVVELGDLPADATAVTFEITGRWAWKSTKLSVCSGSTVTAACTAAPALVTPVQQLGRASVTVPLTGGARTVVVHNSAASVRVGLTLTSYSTTKSASYLSNVVLAPGQSTTVDLGLPAGTASATLTVAGRWAWRPTQIAVCPGSAASAACLAAPALTTPTQTLGTATVKVDLAGSGGKVTVHNSSASVRVWLDLASYETASASATTSAPASSTGSSTATATARPTSSATATATTTQKPTATATPTPTATTATPKPTATATATAKPTATASPSQGASAGGSSARPGPSNTGVPAGTKLTVHDGDLTITKDGTVVDGLDVRGFVQVNATGVVIKNSIIRGRDTAYDKALVMMSTTVPASAKIQDTTLAASTPSPHIRGVIGARFSLTRVDAYDVVDQVLIIGDDVTVQDSWLHDNAYFEQDPNYNNTPSHDDNVQISIGKNLRFVNNTMTGTHNSVMMVTQDRGKVSDLVFSGNHVDGGACSVNLAEKAYGPLSGLTFTDNVFGRNTTVSNCAIIAPSTTTPLLTLAANFYTDGVPVTVHRG